MGYRKSRPESNTSSIESKQSFLASAISDISTYIQLADTKVSIIMGALLTLLAGIISAHEPIGTAITKITPCSWLGIVVIIISSICFAATVGVFVFGILTIRGHVCIIDYKSKWFLPKSTKEYSFDTYKKDVARMDDIDILENMEAELYKLNDINRQKAKTMKWAMRCFAVALATLAVLAVVILVKFM